MFGLDDPVIPCLQDLDKGCDSNDCQYDSEDKELVLFNDKLETADTIYYTCIQIENNQTDDYNKEFVPNEEKNPTVWYSDNVANPWISLD